ncbi:hypothetical protein GCM10009414_21530 [Tatumella terrea]
MNKVQKATSRQQDAEEIAIIDPVVTGKTVYSLAGRRSPLRILLQSPFTMPGSKNTEALIPVKATNELTY